MGKGKGEGGKGKGEREGRERKKIETFEDLKVWQKGIDLVKQIYLRTKEGELSKDFGLRDQLRRATVSIPTNIAEGFERYSRKEYLNFLNIAKGSAGEVCSLLRVALEVGYLDQPTYTQLSNQAMELSRMLSNQIQSINQSLKQ
ncbi:four helix bundle protein [Nostoc sp. 2RC]|nr:four helix bundle protein [Nostoc sp. 2RC]